MKAKAGVQATDGTDCTDEKTAGIREDVRHHETAEMRVQGPARLAGGRAVLSPVSRSGVRFQQVFGFGGEGGLAGGQGEVAGFLRMGPGFFRFVLADEGEG